MRRSVRRTITVGLTTLLLAGCGYDELDDDAHVPDWTAPADDSTAPGGSNEEASDETAAHVADDSTDPARSLDRGGAFDPDSPPETSVEMPSPGEQKEPNPFDGFVVHEWGTFTSVVDSDGNYLQGLHHEEESLPAFVHRLGYQGVDGGRLSKGMPYLPKPVVQKLETPVLYFYSDSPRDVRVSVDFPKGFISEWYPQSASRSPSKLPDCGLCSPDIETRYLRNLADGSMTWEATITNEPQKLVDVPPDDVWAPSRKVPAASWVTRGGEAEKFIFYRGVGRFEPPFVADIEKVDPGRLEIHASNNSEQAIGQVYLLDVHETDGRIVELGDVPADSTETFAPAPKEMPLPIDELMDEAKSTVASGLVDAGLTDDEAEAMVETWARSYFAKPGYRLLYVLPPEWTERYLPTEIEPTPDELLRVLVGRVEILTPEVESETLDRLREAYEHDRDLTDIASENRFAEPRFRRACQLADDDGIEPWCHRQIQMLSSEVMRVETH